MVLFGRKKSDNRCQSVGWGAHWDQNLAQGVWSGAEAASSSNWRELRAVAVSLAAFLQAFQGYHVQILSYNATTVAYLNKWGPKKQGPSVSYWQQKSWSGQKISFFPHQHSISMAH